MIVTQPSLVEAKTHLYLSLFESPVSAGFPSPAADYVEKMLDLNELCIEHPNATYFVRAQGDSMIDAGISSGDVLIVDRAKQPVNGNIIVAAINGEFTVKYFTDSDGVKLKPANENYKNIELSDGDELDVFGVVTFILKSAR